MPLPKRCLFFLLSFLWIPSITLGQYSTVADSSICFTHDLSKAAFTPLRPDFVRINGIQVQKDLYHWATDSLYFDRSISEAISQFAEVCFYFSEIKEPESKLYSFSDWLILETTKAKNRADTSSYWQKKWDKQLSKKTKPSAFNNLEQSGSIRRALVFGNNQSASLQSGMDFKMSGYLSDSVYVSAQLNDQNTPVQADGSSLQLRDFDRVLIELKSPKLYTSFGDVDLVFDQSSVYKLNRRGQGLNVKYKGANWRSQVALSVNRGKYRNIQLNPIDGVSGPYRLNDDTGENFIIILSGTEKVYLNGRLLSRGENNDYIMDYTYGEIRFNPSIVIRETDRIFVEYQYLNQDYNRIVMGASSALDFGADKKQQWTISVAREFDDISTLSSFSNADESRALLKNAGSSNTRVLLPSYREVDAEEDRNAKVLYIRKDTTINTKTKTIFRVSEEGKFDVYFSFVGEGQGDYQQLSSTQNILSYKYVGEGNGTYLPGRLVSTPQDLVVISNRLKGEVLDRWYYDIDFGLSSWRYNRLAKQHSDLKTSTKASFSFKPTDVFEINYNTWIQQKGFVEFDRMLDADFYRQWALNKQFSLDGWQIHSVSSELNTVEKGSYVGSYSMLNSQKLEADKFNIELESGVEQSLFYSIKYDKSTTAIRDSLENDFYDLNSEVGFNLAKKQFYIGWVYNNQKQDYQQFEQNRGYSKAFDWFHFYETGPVISFTNKSVGIRLTHKDRTDKRVMDGNIRSQKSTITSLESSVRTKELDLKQSISYLDKKKNADLAASNTINGSTKLKYENNRKSIRSLVDYQLSSSTQSIYRDVYVYAGTQLGMYYWDDLNDDGVQQLDEFFPERTEDEGEYVLQRIPATEQEAVTDFDLTVRNTLKLDDLVKVLASIGELGYENSLRYKEVNRTDDKWRIFRLDPSIVRERGLTLNGFIRFRQQLNWTSKNKIWNAKADWLVADGMSELNSYRNTDAEQNIRVVIGKKIHEKAEIGIDLSQGLDKNIVKELASRSFDLKKIEQQLYLKYRLNAAWLIQTEVYKRDIKDRFPAEKVESRSLGIDQKVYYLNSSEARIELNFGWRHLELEGNPSANSLYEITNGQGVGQAFQLDSKIHYFVSRKLTLEVNYALRSRKGMPALQTVRMAMQVHF